MNKRFFILSALLSIVGTVFAQTTSFSVKSPQEVPYGAIGEIEVNYQFEAEGVFTAYSMYLSLPEGFTLIDDGEGGYVMNGGDCNAASHTIAVNFSEGYYKMTCSSQKSTPFKNVSGTLLTIPVSVDGTKVELGKEYQASISNVMISYLDGQSKAINTDGINFTLKVVENRITLDETVGVTDETPTGTQNVLVKRTIKAGNWSTICLPFAMDADQMKTAFGEGVELADFTSYDPAYDADDNVTSIEVNFTTTSEFKANHPYIVKVGADITEIKLDGVMLEPSEEDAYIEYDNGKTGRQRVVYGTFVGTYTAETVVPEDDLFLSGNKFYYSTGSTKMKAFRGFFELTDVLAVKASGAKINISVDGEATSIDGIGTQRVVEGVYDLSGRKIQLEDGDVNKLQKGVYIINGKKVTIK